MFSGVICFGGVGSVLLHGMERVIASKSMMMRKAMSAAVIRLFIGFGGVRWLFSGHLQGASHAYTRYICVLTPAHYAEGSGVKYRGQTT
jgi:hypothetical protein